MRDKLLSLFGSEKAGTLQGFFNFAYVPDDKVERLAGAALDEDWGKDRYVLKRYLALHVRMAIEQNAFCGTADSLVVTAGLLQTRYGTPLYLVFRENRIPGRQQFYLEFVGDRPTCSTLPQPPELPPWPTVRKDAEIVIAHEHILGENEERVGFLKATPRVAQMCAVAGAIQWSLHRSLEIRQLYLGTPNYFVPLYLQTRENITDAPDLVAPIQVQPNHLLVRTVLEPYMAYPWARVVAARHDQLPPWLLAAWSEHGEHLSESDVEKIEAAELGTLTPEGQDKC